MNVLLRKLIEKKLLNNLFINWLIIGLGLENKLKKIAHPYQDFKIKEGASLQEIAGYSIRPEINEVLEKVHKQLADSKNYLNKLHPSILDIGCGPGLFLKDFETSGATLYGVDITKAMIDIAQRELPNANFMHSDFMQQDFKSLKFDLIYTVGMMIYLSRSDIQKFIQKIHALLNSEGIVFLSFPHATSLKDVFYHDITYIQYSPSLIEKLLEKEQFEILESKHAFDGRLILSYDKQAYPSLNPNTPRTYKNSYIIIARKKP